MATPSSQSITMTAEPAAIMDVIADFAAYPEWAGAVKSVEVTVPGENGRASQVRFSMDAGLLKDTYELAYQWDDDGMGVSWSLVSGQLMTVPLRSTSRLTAYPWAGTATPSGRVWRR